MKASNARPAPRPVMTAHRNRTNSTTATKTSRNWMITKAFSAGRSTWMTRSPVTRYVRRISSGVGKRGKGLPRGIGRLLCHAADEVDELVPQVDDEAAQGAEEVADGVPSGRRTVPDRHDDERDHQPDQ